MSGEIVFNVRRPKPLRNFPPGRVRLRVRVNNFAFAYVKTSSGIRCFAIRDTGEFWEPAVEAEQGFNCRQDVRMNFSEQLRLMVEEKGLELGSLERAKYLAIQAIKRLGMDASVEGNSYPDAEEWVEEVES